MTGRFILVEDTYGVGFHRFLVEKLFENKVLLEDKPKSKPRPRVRRLPAKKCNPSLSRKVRAILFDHDLWKVLVVIDTEYRSLNKALRDVADHFTEKELKNMRLVAVNPKHEAWLCIGIGGDRRACRSRPEDTISRIIGRPYEKYMLSSLTSRLNIEPLLTEEDFEEYVNALKWLINDP